MEDVTRFYEWLLKIKSIHLADNKRMNRAYRIVYNNQQLKPQKKCTQST